MFGRWLFGSLIIAMFIGIPPLAAQINPPLIEVQEQRPLVPMPDAGLAVIPFMDGWYENEDGTFSISFGYYNLNRGQDIEIPLGPNNFIEPKEFDGHQPTFFPSMAADGEDNDGAALPPRRERARGVFTVTIPADYKGDVVWTLSNLGETYTVPGRTKSIAYSLNWPMAMGSVPPLLRFQPDGPAGRGPMGIEGGPIQASAGVATTLTAWFTDDSVRDKPLVEIKPRDGKVLPVNNVSWFKHQGPGKVEFDPQKEGVEDPTTGKVTTSATFSEPGEYVIRVVVDDHGTVDSSWGNQCCWTNGYLKVSVTP